MAVRLSKAPKVFEPRECRTKAPRSLGDSRQEKDPQDRVRINSGERDEET